MKLADYFFKFRVNKAEFARKIQATRAAIYLWINGERIPRELHIKRIEKETEGRVTRSDFKVKP